MSEKCSTFVGGRETHHGMRSIAEHICQKACRVVCVLGLVCSAMCGLSSCRWQEARDVIEVADSIDQNHHVIYDDTAALGQTIRTLDNPFGRLLMSNTLGKAYYYMGRNLEDSYQQVVEAAECYIEADRLQIDDPIYRGRVNVCMGYICSLNKNDSLSLVFYERASEDFQGGGNDWYYAQTLLDIIELNINLRNFIAADSLTQIAQSYRLDSAYQARYYETCGLYFYEQQQYDSALVYLQRGLEYWQTEEDKCFSCLKILQIYLDKEALDEALPYAKYIVNESRNPNYISNAYYCLMQDAKRKNNTELLSQYSHARTDAQRLLRDNTNKYAEAIPKLMDYLLNPHPLRWVWITIICFSILCCGLLIVIVVYRKYTIANIRIANKTIKDLSTRINEQTNTQISQLQYLEFEKCLHTIRTKYSSPQKQWKEYKKLKKDVEPYLPVWIEKLEELHLTDSEYTYCIYSLIYPHFSLRELSNYMNYSYSGLRVLKSHLLKKLNIPTTNFHDSLKDWAVSYR